MVTDHNHKLCNTFSHRDLLVQTINLVKYWIFIKKLKLEQPTGCYGSKFIQMFMPSLKRFCLKNLCEFITIGCFWIGVLLNCMREADETQENYLLWSKLITSGNTNILRKGGAIPSTEFCLPHQCWQINHVQFFLCSLTPPFTINFGGNARDRFYIVYH